MCRSLMTRMFVKLMRDGGYSYLASRISYHSSFLIPHSSLFSIHHIDIEPFQLPRECRSIELFSRLLVTAPAERLPQFRILEQFDHGARILPLPAADEAGHIVFDELCLSIRLFALGGAERDH